MGTYRFVLAMLVLLSHTLITWWGYNPGVVAVISFFVISGYAMAGTIRKNFANRDKVLDFYADRVLRIFPQYLFYVAVTAAFFYAGLIASDSFLSEMGPRRALLNIPILPLGIPRATGFDISRSSFIPQAWSLALELTFYAVVPLLVLWMSQAQRRVVAALSCAVALLAATQVIDAHAYGYFTLPGTLFIFMIGIELYERRDPLLLRSLIAFAAVLCALVHAVETFRVSVTQEVTIGIVLAIVIVPAIAALKLPPAIRAIDRMLGHLSYGLFLNHFIFIWLLQRHYGLGNVPFDADKLAILIAASTLAAAVTHWLIDRPIEQLRHRLRSRNLLVADVDLPAVERVGAVGTGNPDTIQTPV